MADNITMHL